MNVENDIIQTELIEKDILLNRKCFIRFLMDKNNIRLYINIFYKTFQVFIHTIEKRCSDARKRVVSWESRFHQ